MAQVRVKVSCGQQQYVVGWYSNCSISDIKDAIETVCGSSCQLPEEKMDFYLKDEFGVIVGVREVEDGENYAILEDFVSPSDITPDTSMYEQLPPTRQEQRADTPLSIKDLKSSYSSAGEISDAIWDGRAFEERYSILEKRLEGMLQRTENLKDRLLGGRQRAGADQSTGHVQARDSSTSPSHVSNEQRHERPMSSSSPYGFHSAAQEGMHTDELSFSMQHAAARNEKVQLQADRLVYVMDNFIKRELKTASRSGTESLQVVHESECLFFPISSAILTKYPHGSAGKPDQRRVWLNGTVDKLQWSLLSSTKLCGSVAVTSLVEVLSGRKTETFWRWRRESVDNCCFSLTLTDNSSLDFQCGEAEQRDKWVAAFKFLLQSQNSDPRRFRRDVRYRLSVALLDEEIQTMKSQGSASPAPAFRISSDPLGSSRTGRTADTSASPSTVGVRSNTTDTSTTIRDQSSMAGGQLSHSHLDAKVSAMRSLFTGLKKSSREKTEDLQDTSLPLHSSPRPSWNSGPSSVTAFQRST